MEKPEVPKLKITTQCSCEFILNLFQTYTKEEIRQRQRYYIQQIEYLQTINNPKEII